MLPRPPNTPLQREVGETVRYEALARKPLATRGLTGMATGQRSVLAGGVHILQEAVASSGTR